MSYIKKILRKKNNYANRRLVSNLFSLSFSNWLSRKLLKKYGVWFLDKEDIVQVILEEYKDCEFICMYIGGNQYTLAKLLAISFFLEKISDKEIKVYTNFFDIKILQSQIYQSEFISKIKDKRKKVILTIGKNVNECINYLNSLNLENSTYETIALDYEIMNRL